MNLYRGDSGWLNNSIDKKFNVSGLFHNAVSSGGSSLSAWALPQTKRIENSMALASSVNCPTFNTRLMMMCLKRKPVKQLYEASAKFFVRVEWFATGHILIVWLRTMSMCFHFIYVERKNCNSDTIWSSYWARNWGSYYIRASVRFVKKWSSLWCPFHGRFCRTGSFSSSYKFVDFYLFFSTFYQHVCPLKIQQDNHSYFRNYLQPDQNEGIEWQLDRRCSRSTSLRSCKFHKSTKSH